MRQFIYLFIIIFLSIVQSVIAQEEGKYSKNFGIHIMPYTMLDYTPRLRLGIDYNTDNKLAYSFDVGIGNYFLNKSRLDGMLWNENYFFNEIRLELKYFIKRKSNYILYCGPELFNIYMSDNIRNGYYHKENSSLTVIYDEAEFNKHKLGLHIKGGAELIFFNSISLDFYGGAGFAYRNIYYKNIINPDIGEYHIFEEWWGHAYKYEGKSLIFHITLGIKLGILF